MNYAGSDQHARAGSPALSRRRERGLCSPHRAGGASGGRTLATRLVRPTCESDRAPAERRAVSLIRISSVFELAG